jgi:glycosyltransferase involved in cell wall biosynthesis
MRVLLISWEYPPYVVGGIGTHVAQLTPQLAYLAASRNGGDEPLHVDVVTTRFAGGEPIERPGEFVTIHRVDLPAMDALDLYNGVIESNSGLVDYALQLGSEQPYDLIHAHDWLTADAAIKLKHLWKTPLVVTIHATERGRHQGWLPSATSAQIDNMEWRVTFEAWRVIVCSEYMRAELHRSFGIPIDKMTVIPNGVDTTAIGHCSQEEMDHLRGRLAHNGERLLLYVGRITPEKGAHVLVEAMPLVLTKYPDVLLLVAGKNSQKLLPMAQQLGIQDNVRVLGYVTDEMRDCLYAIADAAIFPSLYEPFGIVALEAMASNCNVIVSETGGLAEVVEHGRTGLTAYPNDPGSIAWAVDRLFENPAAAMERRAAALKEVNTLYRWDIIAASTVALYERVHRERVANDW